MKIYELNKTIGVVEVPHNATDFKIIMADIFSYNIPKLQNRCQTLGSSGWQFLSLSKDMTEEQAKMIMPMKVVGINTEDCGVLNDVLWLDYETQQYELCEALESTRSWERSKGIEGNIAYLIKG